MNELIGCDVSHWEVVSNWDKVETAFCITKASQGTEMVDAKFASYWKEMKRVGIPRGSYHFLDAQHEAQGAAEARHYLSVLESVGDLQPGDLPYCVDMEGTGTPAGAAGFIAEVKRLRPGSEVMLYCSMSVIPKRTFWDILKRKAKWCGGKYLWVARYWSGDGPGVTQWHIYQSSDGKYGIEPHSTPGIGNCDIDRLHGGQARLDRMKVK